MIDGHHFAEDPPCGGSGVAYVLATARSFAEALGSLCPGELPDAALSELLVELDAAWNRISAGRVALLGVWDARVAWAADGAQSGPGWVAARTEQARGAVSGEIRVARGLRAMPVTEKAFLSGDLGFAKVRLLVDLAKDLPDAYAEAEAFLVEQVQTVRVDQVPIVLARWRALVDTDGEEERAARQYEERSLNVSPLMQGAWRTDGNLTAEVGEVFRNAIDRRARELYRAEKAAADANGDKVKSTAAQRRHDALHELILQATAAGDAGNERQRPGHHRHHRRHRAPRRRTRRDRRRDRTRHARARGDRAAVVLRRRHLPRPHRTRLHPPRPRPHRPAPQPRPTPRARRQRPRLHLPGM